MTATFLGTGGGGVATPAVTILTLPSVRSPTRWSAGFGLAGAGM